MINRRLAVIRIHGITGIKKVEKDTLHFLRLYKKNTCVVVSNSGSVVGMISKINNHVTWGEIDEETLKILLLKRGKLARKTKLTEEYIKKKLNLSLEDFAKKVVAFKSELKDLPGFKLFFKLTPPKGGFEKNGIKKQFAQGGVVGYRKDKINNLIKRMV